MHTALQKYKGIFLMSPELDKCRRWMLNADADYIVVGVVAAVTLAHMRVITTTAAPQLIIS